MVFNVNWRSPHITRLVIFSITIFAASYALLKPLEFYVTALLGLAILFQLGQLIQSLDLAATPPGTDPGSIRLDEQNLTASTSSSHPHTVHLVQRLNEGLERIRQIRKERDSEHQFFKNIVQHIGIGILTFRRDGAIQMINTAAKKLLRLQRAEKMDDLREVSHALAESMLLLKTGGRELITLKTGDETVQLAVYAIELTLRNEEVKLISMSNIQSELEEKEMEAWQNLVRVLTHEIMNSVTPISSLAGMVESDLSEHMAKQEGIRVEALPDLHLSMQTISKRSRGLIGFVKEFRNLTHVQKPRIAPVAVKDLLEEMVVLHKKDLSDKAIQTSVRVTPEQLTIPADKALIEQVLINLIKNAIQAFDEQSDKKIELRAAADEAGNGFISVSDNGPGIEPEALDKIFIPFYSTKKAGSGIGLSLSKQIMRMHEGRIAVRSEAGRGTEFVLRF
jgi:nitrogen fixation/metabolism regulation signal transduction histidine kinase